MGKTDLGKWMITNGGEYSADATYEQLTMVKYGNSTYITLKTVTGITPVDDKINYQLMAQGFDATALSAVQAEDTQGLCGEKGEIVTAQSLVDALADKVMNTVMAKIGTAALTGGMTDLSSGVNSLYSNLASTERLFDGTADSAGLYNLSKSIRGFRALIFTILCGNGEYYTALIPVASVVTNAQLFYMSNTVYVDYVDALYNSGISVKFENDISFTVVNQYHKTWPTPIVAAVDGLH